MKLETRIGRYALHGLATIAAFAGILFMQSLVAPDALISSETAQPLPAAEHGGVVLKNTETFTIGSRYADKSYFIKVALPRHYRESAKTYPVLYVTDAETNFGAMQYLVQRLAKDKLMPEVILVGIAYDVDYDTFYKLRERDLRPALDARFAASPAVAAATKGAAGLFSEFIRKELIPAIDSRYRTQPGERAVYGHSYGGLYATYAFLFEPDLFNRYLILSPSLWWPADENHEYVLVNRARTLALPETDARVFFGSGELEPRIDDLQTEFLAGISDRLAPGVALKAEVYPNETHRTVFGRGAMDGLRFLYGS